MSIRRVLAAGAVSAVLVAGSAAALPSDSSPERELIEAQEVLIAEQRELIEAQEVLIAEQRELIEAQEDLLNAYRCEYGVDVSVIPGGCPDRPIGPAEIADGAVLCTAWLAERSQTGTIVETFTALALVLERGIITVDHSNVQRALGRGPDYQARVEAAIPALQSERLAGLFAAMADSIQQLTDANSSGAGNAEMASAIRTALDRLHDLDQSIGDICN